MATDAQLHEEFARYCAFGAGQAGSSEMDSAKFLKMLRECALVDKKLSPTDLDLIFTRVKPAGAKRIDYTGFTAALREVAARRGSSYEAVATRVAARGGPGVGSATVAAPTRFYDDKSTFTGVHAHGGPPTTNDYAITLDNLADRSDANMRGVKVPSVDATAAHRESLLDKPTAKVSPRRSSSTATRDAVPVPLRPAAPAAAAAAPPAGGLEARVADVFVAFASSTTRMASEIDSARFVKLVTDARLLDSRLTRTQCDLVFTRAAGGGKRLGWAGFRDGAVPHMAEVKGCSEEAVLSAIAGVTAVTSTGTVPDAVRFHDDKTTYTGVHTAGGPTTNDYGITLCTLADRGDADVRGVQAQQYQAMPSPLPALRGRSLADDRRRSSGSVGAGTVAVAPRPSSSSPLRRESNSSAGRRDSAARRDSGAATGARKSSLSAAGGTIAGSANRSGGVYDRLSNVSTYTGVYAERFKGGPHGGRINDDTVNVGPSGFNGSTNSAANAPIRDLSQICRR